MNARVALAVLITIVWASTYLVAIADRTFTPPPEVNAVMMIVAGFFFASGLRKDDDT